MWQAPEDIKKELQNVYLNVEGLLEESGEKKR
jgi:hypothetical protein